MTDDPRPRAFTDAELAAILEAPSEESTAALARRLGRNVGAVGRVRRRLLGGACPVDWQPCVVCGEPVPLRPSAPPVHLRCRRAHRRVYLAARYRANPAAQQEASRRWKERDPAGFAAMLRESAQRKKRHRPEVFAAQLDRLDAFRKAEQTRTKPYARQSGARWSEADDAHILATMDRPLADVALALGRTWRATSTRRWVLRRRTDAP